MGGCKASAFTRLILILGGLSARALPAAAQTPLEARLADTRDTVSGILAHVGQTLTPAGGLDIVRIAALVLVVGLAVSLVALSSRHLRLRWTVRQRERALQAELRAAHLRADRAESFLAGEPQIVVTWAEPDAEPIIEGDTSIASVEEQPRRVLAFGSYLVASDAQAVETAIEQLKRKGETFALTAQTTVGRFLAIDGRVVGTSLAVRLREVTGDRAELARAEDLLVTIDAELCALRKMLDALPQPVWVRDAEGSLVWRNSAYRRAVAAPGGVDADTADAELLDQQIREEAARRREHGVTYAARVPAVIAGDRRTLDVIEVPSPTGSAGMATDVSETEALRDEIERQSQAHARTLDQLPTGVAIFDKSQRLVFHNAAYRLIWSLDAAYLESRPTDGEILERLRADRRLPEEADFRRWKASVLAGYHAVEPSDEWWYLPDGRTLRVVTTPNPQGGVTYLFDDVSERFQLESRYNGLIRVQGETLDTLREGVAVFGPDGRLRLANPAFGELWRLPADLLAAEPHVDEIAARGRRVAPDDEAWAEIRAAVVGLTDSRRASTCRIEKTGGLVVDCAIAPLPDGATLLTFTDVTAGATMERVLTERNEALLKTAQLREDFVHHVSYELRSPLTTIVGFVELLNEGHTGPLNGKQKEYAGHILGSSKALLAIIDDILDLATIDSGSMALDREQVDIRATIDAAARGVEDRLAEASIGLAIDVPRDIGRFEADGKRIRQILFNLLSNAVSFSTSGQTVSLTVRRDNDAVIFDVADEGRGIPADVIDDVFGRSGGSRTNLRNRGVGLSLSIVRSFVELHGGHVDISSEPGRGTHVTCTFPADGSGGLRVAVAAE